MSINPNFQQAMGSVPYYSQQQAPVQAPQQPINFQGGGAEVAEKEGGLSLGKIALFATLAIGAVGAHKTSALGKEFKALQGAEGSKIAKEAEYKFGSNLLHNCNPLNWFGNAKTAEALKAEGSGFTKLGDSNKFIQNEAGDILQISGKNTRKLDGSVTDDATSFFNKTKDAEVKTEANVETKTDAKTGAETKPNTEVKSEVKSEAKVDVKPEVVKLTSEEKVLAKKYTEIKSEIAKIKNEMATKKPGSKKHKDLAAKLEENIDILKTDEMKDLNSKLKDLKNQRKEFNAEVPTVSKEEKLKKAKELANVRNLDPKIMDANTTKAYAEIKKTIFGGNEIKKAEPKKKLLGGNSVNTSRIKKLDTMLAKAENELATIKNIKSPEALALQDKIFAIDETIKLLK